MGPNTQYTHNTYIPNMSIFLVVNFHLFFSFIFLFRSTKLPKKQTKFNKTFLVNKQNDNNQSINSVNHNKNNNNNNQNYESVTMIRPKDCKLCRVHR